MIGKIISHYRVCEKIGAGGMGVVYKAEDTRLGRFVALKFMPSELSRDRQALERFKREARAASALDHPNICPIYDIGEEDNQPFIVMQLLEGQTLRERIAAGPIKIDEALRFSIQITDALAAAHARGIVHRDIKPANVFITTQGIAKILDFGLAKDLSAAAGSDSELPTLEEHLTQANSTLGTISYMSPEQARGEDIDGRTDVFSLGAVLYEMVTSRQAFSGRATAVIFDAILRETPPSAAQFNPELPHALEEVIRRALEKNRNLRYQTASDLSADLQRVMRDSSASAAVPSSPKARSRPGTANGKRIIAAMAVFALALFLSLQASLWFFHRSGKAIDSVAVLPFANAGGDPNTEYLSDGLTETLIDNLGQLPHLTVMSRNAVLRYKGRETDAQTAGRELQVQGVLTGRVVHHGDDLSISAELVNVANNSHIWGQEYSRKTGDLLAIQEEITHDIAGKLSGKLSGEEEKRLAKRSTTNPEAYQLYLKGRYNVERWTPDTVAAGIGYFRQAIALDPNYALAYTGVAYASVLPVDLWTAPKESMPQAIEATAKALQLDDTLPEAHMQKGFNDLIYTWDWQDAEREFQRTLELKPDLAIAHFYYGWLLIPLKRFDEVLQHSRRAIELDPLSVETNVGASQNYYFARQLDLAISQAQKTVQIDPTYYFTHFLLGLAYDAKRDYAHAIPELEKAGELEKNVPWELSSLGHADAMAGRKKDADRALEELKAWSKRGYVPAYGFAEMYLAMGDKEKALAELERAYDDRSTLLTFINTDPRFDSLRSDPRFQNLIRRMNFPNP